MNASNMLAVVTDASSGIGFELARQCAENGFELKGTGVTVTCLMPGATETDFCERAGMMDTRVGRSRKDDPAEVAEIGFKAMMDGDGVTGWQNKLGAAIANITPAALLAEQHRSTAEPGSGLKK